MDRGMVSKENVEFLRERGRGYILGTPKGRLKSFERELLFGGWTSIRGGLEVKLCPRAGGEETFILCRSADRREKERAMQERFEKWIGLGLEKIATQCRRRGHKAVAVAERVGRLVGRNALQPDFSRPT
jgi:hypothetical protein